MNSTSDQATEITDQNSESSGKAFEKPLLIPSFWFPTEPHLSADHEERKRIILIFLYQSCKISDINAFSSPLLPQNGKSKSFL